MGVGPSQPRDFSNNWFGSLHRNGDFSGDRHFNLLSDDVVSYILSYVATGPFECERDYQGSLVNVLPLVCKQFRATCNSSEPLWMAALQRLIRSDQQWEDSIGYLISASSERTFGDCSQSPPWALGGQDTPMWRFKVRYDGKSLKHMSTDKTGLYLSLLGEAIRGDIAYAERRRMHNALLSNESETEGIASAKHTYMRLVKDHRLLSLPLFCWPVRDVSLGRVFMVGLQPLDSRCRRLIEDLMSGRTRAERKKGRVMSEPRPRFVFACQPPLSPGAHAFVAELFRCRVHPSGRSADVYICPMKRIRMVEVKERQGGGGIVHATFRSS